MNLHVTTSATTHGIQPRGRDQENMGGGRGGRGGGYGYPERLRHGQEEGKGEDWGDQLPESAGAQPPRLCTKKVNLREKKTNTRRRQ